MLARAVYPLECIVGRFARAAYMPPLQATRDFLRKRYTAGGACPAPTNHRKVSSYRQDAHFRQICRGRIDASRAVYPLDCIVGKIARAAYMPPLQATRDFCGIVIPWAGRRNSGSFLWFSLLLPKERTYVQPAVNPASTGRARGCAASSGVFRFLPCTSGCRRGRRRRSADSSCIRRPR